MCPMNNFGGMCLTPLRDRLHSSSFSAVNLLVNAISFLRYGRREKCHDPLKNSTFRNSTLAEIALQEIECFTKLTNSELGVAAPTGTDIPSSVFDCFEFECSTFLQNG